MESLKTGSHKLATALLLPINPAAVILLGIFTTVWGFWVGNPFWDAFSRDTAFEILSNFAPEWFWGGVAVAVGVVITYGAVRRSYHSLTTGAQVGWWHWLIISTLLFAGDWMSTHGIGTLIFAIYSAFIYLNIKVNFKEDKNSDKILH